MVAYSYYRGVSAAALGGVRGVGAVFGISATLIFPYLTKRCVRLSVAMGLDMRVGSD